METIRKAIEIVGGVTNLARQVGVTPQTVYVWLSGSAQIRASHAAKIERITGGKVTAMEIGTEFALLGIMHDGKDGQNPKR